MPDGVPVLNRVENMTQFIQRMRENNMVQSQELVLDKDTIQLRFVRV